MKFDKKSGGSSTECVREFSWGRVECVAVSTRMCRIKWGNYNFFQRPYFLKSQTETLYPYIYTCLRSYKIKLISRLQGLANYGIWNVIDYLPSVFFFAWQLFSKLWQSKFFDRSSLFFFCARPRRHDMCEQRSESCYRHCL